MVEGSVVDAKAELGGAFLFSKEDGGAIGGLGRLDEALFNQILELLAEHVLFVGREAVRRAVGWCVAGLQLDLVVNGALGGEAWR